MRSNSSDSRTVLRAPAWPSRTSRSAESSPAVRGMSSRARPKRRSRTGPKPESPASARIGTRSRTNSHQCPRARPRKVPESLHEFGRVVAALGVRHDGGGPQQFQRRLPETVGRVQPICRRDGVVRTPVELGERQGQPANQVFVSQGLDVHSRSLQIRGAAPPKKSSVIAGVMDDAILMERFVQFPVNLRRLGRRGSCRNPPGAAPPPDLS